jgi:uncharacterized protein YdeI (YjbR/CyaY-like superfamily)
MTNKDYEITKTLVTEIEGLKAMIRQLNSLITNEASGISVTVKGMEAVEIPISMSPLRELKRLLQAKLDIKETYFSGIIFSLPKAGARD